MYDSGFGGLSVLRELRARLPERDPDGKRDGEERKQRPPTVSRQVVGGTERDRGDHRGQQTNQKR